MLLTLCYTNPDGNAGDDIDEYRNEEGRISNFSDHLLIEKIETFLFVWNGKITNHWSEGLTVLNECFHAFLKLQKCKTENIQSKSLQSWSWKVDEGERGRQTAGWCLLFSFHCEHTSSSRPTPTHPPITTNNKITTTDNPHQWCPLSPTLLGTNFRHPESGLFSNFSFVFFFPFCYLIAIRGKLDCWPTSLFFVGQKNWHHPLFAWHHISLLSTWLSMFVFLKTFGNS